MDDGTAEQGLGMGGMGFKDLSGITRLESILQHLQFVRYDRWTLSCWRFRRVDFVRVRLIRMIPPALSVACNMLAIRWSTNAIAVTS